ncbi:MAG: hypothetical protein U0525_00415 [Patescibacteria group bacterium]
MNYFLQNKRKIENFLVISASLFIVLGLVYQLVNLSNIVPFHDWDEAIYAQVAKEFMRNPGFLLTYNGSAWFEKPFLPSFLYALSWWLIPVKKELVARSISVFLSLLSLLTIFKIVRKLKISKYLAVSALLFTTYSSMYIDRSLLVNVDIMLTFGWLVYSLGYLDNNILYKVVGLIFGVLSKSLLGFFPLLTEIGVSVIYRKITFKKIFQWTLLITLSSLWHIYMIIVYKQDFIKSHFLDHMVSRVTRPIELHFGDKWFYISKLFEVTNIILVLSVVGVVIFTIITIRKRLRNESLPKDIRGYLFLFALPITYLALLTISKSKLHWYITPIIPFISIWTVVSIDQILRASSKNQSLIIRIGTIGLDIFVLVLFGLSVTHIQADWYTPTDKTIIGICIGKNKQNAKNITYVVLPQERKDANVIEAANLQIGSSFIYGSAPAFVYYSDLPVDFVYRESEIMKSATNSDILVISKEDLKNPVINKSLIEAQNPPYSSTPFCKTSTLVALRKKA